MEIEMKGRLERCLEIVGLLKNGIMSPREGKYGRSRLLLWESLGGEERDNNFTFRHVEGCQTLYRFLIISSECFYYTMPPMGKTNSGKIE